MRYSGCSGSLELEKGEIESIFISRYFCYHSLTFIVSFTLFFPSDCDAVSRTAVLRSGYVQLLGKQGWFLCSGCCERIFCEKAWSVCAVEGGEPKIEELLGRNHLSYCITEVPYYFQKYHAGLF